MSKRQVNFDPPSASSKQQSQITKKQPTKTTKKQDDDFDEYADDNFEQDSPNKNKNTMTSLKTQSSQQPQPPSQTLQSNKEGKEEVKKKVSYDDIQTTNQTNKFIIYKFMKKGFTSLSAEDMACIMINPDFTIDFKKNTGEDWNNQYQYKMVDRLNKCKFNLQWATKRQSDDAHEPFFQLVKDGDIGRVVDFLRSSSNLSETLDAVERTSKKSALHVAAAEGHTQMCEFLLNKGARVDARDKLLRTPLHLACQAGNSTVVRLLLENNADPHDKDSSGRTAMHYATCSSAIEQLTILTEHGTDLVHVKDHAGRTPLHYAVFNAHPKQVEMVTKLLNFGADVNALDNDRRTVLHHAAEAGKARVIPLLVQRGASTGTKDSLKNKTPMELAMNDHIKELLIVHSTPQYLPKAEDINLNLAVEGNKMKIEKEPIDAYIPKGKQVKSPLKINRKQPKQQEDSKFTDYDEYQDQQQQYRPPLGPSKEWEKQQQDWLPYNMRNYQDRLMQWLRRVQEFGVQSYHHVKKPYMFTGSWMEHCRNLDDLMLQINGCKANEAVMKIFNILFPYDKPLPKGKGDEMSLQGFYTEKKQQEWDPVQELKDCHPDVLRERMAQENEHDTQNILRNNQVEEIQDLLDLKRQLMSLEQVNNMHQISIQEKDERIKELLSELGGMSSSLNNKKYGVTLNEAEYANLIQQNQELQTQVNVLTEQLTFTCSKMEELNKMIEADDQRKKKEMEDLKSYSKLQEVEMQRADLEKKLNQEKERNRALRFKAGQIFLQAIEKGGDSGIAKAGKKGKEGDYYLEDDDALMRLLQRIEKLGEPGLQQRLLEAGEIETARISKSQFMNFLAQIGTTPVDILSLQRIVGFYEGGSAVQKLKVSDIMLKIMERSQKRGQIEQDTLKTLAMDLKKQGYSIQDAFNHLDDNGSGSITMKELQDAFRGMKVEVGIQTLRNLLKIFDTNGDNQISLQEFEAQMSKYLDNGQLYIPTKEEFKSKIISDELKQELIEDLKKEQKVTVNYENYSLKPLEADNIKKQEALLLEMIKKGQIPPEMINGEIKLQFDKAMGVIDIPNKNVPFIVLNMINYSAEGVKNVTTQHSSTCERLQNGSGNLNKAVRIPLINKDKNKIAEAIHLEFYVQEQEGAVSIESATFIGECFMPWKQALTSPPSQWLPFRDALADGDKRCKQKIKGVVNALIKWIPAGHEDSKYDEQGKKKETVLNPNAKVDYKKQNEGTVGKLELWIEKYTHPEKLPVSAEYYCEAGLSGTFTKQPPKKAADEKTINYYAVLTLPINDPATDTQLTLRFKTKENTEICKSTIDISKLTKDQIIQSKAQPMIIEGLKESGQLQMKIRYNTGKVSAAKLPASLPQQSSQQAEATTVQQKPTAKEEVKQPIAQSQPQPIVGKSQSIADKSPAHVKEEEKKMAPVIQPQTNASKPQVADKSKIEEKPQVTEKPKITEKSQVIDKSQIDEKPSVIPDKNPPSKKIVEEEKKVDPKAQAKPVQQEPVKKPVPEVKKQTTIKDDDFGEEFVIGGTQGPATGEGGFDDDFE